MTWATSYLAASSRAASSNFGLAGLDFCGGLPVDSFSNTIRHMSTDFSEAELQRWLHLRAIEWTGWPAFLSQPIAPVLLIFFRWFYVLGAVMVLGILWAFVRYSFVSPSLSKIGCLFVNFLMWPAALGSAAYLFFVVHSYSIGVLALVWPLLGGFLSVPGQIGRVELMLAKSVGYVEKDAQLGI
jgi:hypothetical protein